MVLARATSDQNWSTPETTEPDAVPDFDQLYQEHFSFVWHCLRRLGVAEAALRDAAQDVFFVVHRRLPEFEGRSPVRSWLYGIAVRVASNYRRTKQRRDQPLQAVDFEDVADPTESNQQRCVEQRQSLDLVHRLVDELDRDKREVFVLSELHELSVSEIADLLNANTGTIYARLRVARQQFERAVARHLAKNKRSP
jgi:RNA polymerase sigma-70 factor (ECF subfamily)